MNTHRPYLHTVTFVAESGGTQVRILGTYSTLARAIAAAQRADAVRPDGTREIRYGRWTRRNRYAHGPVSSWRHDAEVG